MYSIFEEIIKKPIIKTWIGFDDYSYEVSNMFNLNRLFGWLSRSEEVQYREDEDRQFEEEIVSSFDPIITKAFSQELWQNLLKMKKL